jgi:hypothetical protein
MTLSRVLFSFGYDIAAIAAVLLTIWGMRLCWTAPRYRMSLEERAKDGVLSEDQARKRIRVMGWLGPAIAIAGCALLGAVIYR